MKIRTADFHDAALEHLGDEIADLSTHLDAATARLLDLIREFDARGGWNNGFRSCAAWLARGELSYAKVRALTRSRRRKPRSGC